MALAARRKPCPRPRQPFPGRSGRRTGGARCVSGPPRINLSWATARVDDIGALSSFLQAWMICGRRSWQRRNGSPMRTWKSPGAWVLAAPRSCRRRSRRRQNILTHCNAGSLATVDYGTTLGVVRAAIEPGERVHVWVDGLRPRLQGARLTAWEFIRDGIPMTLIADNAGRHADACWQGRPGALQPRTVWRRTAT